MQLTTHNPQTLMAQMGLAETLFQPVWEELAEYLSSRTLEMEALAQQMAIYWNSGSNPGPLGNPANGTSPSSQAVKAALKEPNLTEGRRWMLNELLEMALAAEEAWALDRKEAGERLTEKEPSYQTQRKPYRASKAPLEMIEPFLDEMTAQVRTLFQTQIAGLLSAMVESNPTRLMELMEDPQAPDLLKPMPLLETLTILEQQLADQWGATYQRILEKHPDHQSPSLQARVSAAAEAQMTANEQMGSLIGKALETQTPLQTLLAQSDFMRRLMKTPAAPLSD